MSDCRFGVLPVNYPDPDPDPDDFATTDTNGIVSDHSCLKFTAQMHCYY